MAPVTPPAGPAFVGGATGYVGREVVAALRARGVPTVAHVRPDSKELPAWRERFAALGAETDTTPWEAEAFARTFAERRPGLVFALLGTTRARAEAGGSSAAAEYERVDYGMTRIMLDAAVANGSPRFVYLSAEGVRKGTTNPYLAVRSRLESELQASGLPWLIARPAFITGPDRSEDRPIERIGALLTDALLDMLGALGARRLRARWHSLNGPELARGLVHLAVDGSTLNQTVHADALRSPQPTA
ncbi:MAG: NAD(P)H-binding protein [Gemmatimonadota bacterium]